MRLPVLFLGTILAVCAVSCGPSRSAPATTPDANRIVITPESNKTATNEPRYFKTKPKEWFDEELRQLDQLVKDGVYEPALQRAYQALALRPGDEHKKALQGLIQRANTEVLRLDTLEASIGAEKDPMQFGEPVRVRVRLKNVSGKPIKIAGATRGSSGSLFSLDVTRRSYDTNAQVVAVRRRVYRHVPADVALEPDGETELVLDLGMLDNDQGLDGFRTYTVSGTLRPSVLEVGGLNRWDAIKITRATVRSFRPGFEHLADDPVKRIQQAVDKRAATHLLTATGLVEAGQRTAAVDALIEKLRGDRMIDTSIFGALQYLTEVQFNRDADAWKAWWPRVREKFYADFKPGERDKPAFAER